LQKGSSVHCKVRDIISSCMWLLIVQTSKRQWERRLDAWGLQTNISAEKKRALIKIQKSRHERYGKRTKFYHRGQDLTPKLERFMKNNPEELATVESMPTPSSEFHYPFNVKLR
jgi:hypothetical protein